MCSTDGSTAAAIGKVHENNGTARVWARAERWQKLTPLASKRHAGRPGWNALPRLVLFGALVLFASPGVGVGANLDGVSIPDTQDAAGAHLLLNGTALRTYSFLRIHIYVAGLYLEHRSSDAAAIFKSSQPKLLRFAFERHVDAEDGRKAWREGFARNCQLPCRLPTDMTDRFLAAIPSVEKGDIGDFLFTDHGLDVSLNGHPVGQISDPTFMQVILSVYIGARPVTAAVKRGLLGIPG